MISIREISDLQAEEAIRQGAFPRELLNPDGCAVVILTQSWCGQWTALQRTLREIEQENLWEGPEALHIWTIEYDRKPYFEKFMNFKETVFGNGLVPYLRYYRDGRLTGESNYVSRHGLLDLLKK